MIGRLTPRRLVAAMTLVAILVVGGVVAFLTRDWLPAVLSLGVANLIVIVIGVLVLARRIERKPGADPIRYAVGEPLDSLRRDVQRDVSALLSLYATVPATGPLPAPGGWAATPETLLSLVHEVMTAPGHPLVVECGSGTSTVWTALALRARGGGKVIALEHESGYAEITRRQLARLDLSEFAEVRDAPLEEVTTAAGTTLWYAADALSDLADVTLVFVDGPPGSLGPNARFPALPLLASRLAPGAVVVLDDIDREDEQEIERKWLGGDWGGRRVAFAWATDRAHAYRVVD